MTEPKENTSQHNRFSKDELVKACANFKQLIDNQELLAKNAGKLVRAMCLPVADVRAVLDNTQGDCVKLYYGVLDNAEGEHFIFMCSEDAPKAVKTTPAVTPATANTFLDASTPATAFTMAVSDCIGKRPPCPAINDQFIQ